MIEVYLLNYKHQMNSRYTKQDGNKLKLFRLCFTPYSLSALFLLKRIQIAHIIHNK